MGDSGHGRTVSGLWVDPGAAQAQEATGGADVLSYRSRKGYVTASAVSHRKAPALTPGKPAMQLHTIAASVPEVAYFDTGPKSTCHIRPT